MANSSKAYESNETGEPEETGNLTAVSDSTGKWILATTILGSSMAFIDGTAVNVALPVLQSDLKATVTDVQWVVEGYLLFLSSLILVGGALGDRYGRKRIFGLGIVLFALASAACGIAPSPLFLVIARAAQGIGGALLVPGSLAIINATFKSTERGKAIGIWSSLTTITNVLGPVLGGWLIDTLSWRAVFFINLPLAIVVLVMLFSKVPETRDEKAQKLDWAGAALVTLGLGGVVFGLIEWGSAGLSQPRVVISLLTGVVALALFLVVEARSAAPMMPLGLFRSATFSGTNLLTLLLYAALGGALFFVPFNLIQVQGFSPTAAGAASLPFIVIMFLLSPWAGGLVARYGPRRPLIVGPAIAGVGFGIYTFIGTNANYWTSFFPATVVLGLGMAITVAPLTTTVMGAVESRHSGLASGINNAVARAAGLLAIAVLGIFVVGAFNSSLDTKMARLQVPAEVRQAVDQQRNSLASIQIPPETAPELRAPLKQAIQEAFIDGFRLAFIIAAGMAFASALCTVLLVRGRPTGSGSQ